MLAQNPQNPKTSTKVSFEEDFQVLNQKFNMRGGQAGIYLLKINNRNTRTSCEICSTLTIKTPERRQWQ